MRYPEFLKENGIVGLIAPSFGCGRPEDAVQLDSAIEKLGGFGYSVVEGPNCRRTDGIGKSAPALDCAEEINDFFINNRSDVIISCGGGELMCEDLSYVDFSKISKAKAKWYMGYSDNTNLTFLLPTLADIASIYGCGIKPFGQRVWHKSVSDALEFLEGRKLSFDNYDGWEKMYYSEEDHDWLKGYNITEPYHQEIIGIDGSASECSFSGRLIGGCTDCLTTLCGTRFDKVDEFTEKYKEDGMIWFLESCDLNPFQLRRALWQFKEAGWFKYVKGFLIGRPLHYEDDFDGFTCREAALGVLKEFGVPIVLDIDLGHLSPRIPFVSGGFAKINAKENRFKIEYLLK